jgi:hypothetical protein
MNTEGAIKNGQSRETGNIGYTRRKKKTKQKHNAICVGHHYAKTNTNNVKQSKFVGKHIISKLHLKFIFQNFNNVPVNLR